MRTNVLVLLAALLCFNLCADTVFLKDGSEVTGTIIEENAATITIQLRSGGTRQLRRAEIDSIEKKKSRPTSDAPAVDLPLKKAELAKDDGRTTTSLKAARASFRTKLTEYSKPAEAPEDPAPEVFSLVKYFSTAGGLAGYLTVPPNDNARHPAIVWITGGDCNSIGNVWKEPDRANEQSASAYRNAGIVQLFPSLRGGNKNPGYKEGFLGEVDDVIAAGEYLAKLPYVDPNRIYLGGHSSGGTLVLLTSECTKRFRAVFAFGPTDTIDRYIPSAKSGTMSLPFDTNNAQEKIMRSPGAWLHSIESPTFVIEGTGEISLR